MRRATLGLLSTLLLFSITAAHPATSPIPADDEVIDIQVSPSTILLNWKAKGDVRVTVHADVSYGFFNEILPGDLSVELDGVFATYIYSDARGDLVAKFPYDEIKNMVENETGTATLSLKAVAEDGTIYSGSDDVRVVLN